jgi:hypothetical protein
MDVKRPDRWNKKSFDCNNVGFRFTVRYEYNKRIIKR